MIYNFLVMCNNYIITLYRIIQYEYAVFLFADLNSC
ncbi:hypothetical protein FDB72_03320 [Clostridium botulinum]|uniref:Uncharacterized protein n=1 Tax=Clostridium botulinum (strain Hall / ATCC 3502 / NCTC 13319 / Type A) TaxID=441771 RepID=A5I438_CLOBH|nr:hypothetical protein DB732_11790 [Clostridium botulinum]CAL83809.1 hypothetical protein CBO2269 [Clostridium botulinum A str. ATCC 3502]AWB30910.1 hypothetical protein DBN47_11785 [Clostridium botulinum]EGT5616065.1 hypothetical protein [Clostridium botulinum]EGT5623480.1 hypothetical protein [Clostridium botulinum]